MVPKLSDAFYRMINFHHFWSPKNGSKATLTMILGTIPNFWVPLIIFLEHILCKLFKKKNVPDNSHYLLTQLRITDFLSNSRFSLVGLFAFFGYHRIFYGTQNFYHRKVWNLSFLTHFQPYPYPYYFLKYLYLKFKNTLSSDL